MVQPAEPVTFDQAAEAFLSAKRLSANAARSYTHTLRTIATDLGPDYPLRGLTPNKLLPILTERWGHTSAATWNTRLTALGSFTAWTLRNGWIETNPLAGIDRRTQPRDDTSAPRYETLTELWSRPNIHVREKALWRMLYETAARTNEILSLNIGDLDTATRRATIRGKGGHLQEVVWASGTARVLPRYLRGRRRGPVFVTHRRPNFAPALPDLCPDTGHGRLSYQRAWAQFKSASNGLTLHDLRHAALTHLGESGVGAPLLKAKSRHQSLRSLDRYVRPGIEAVAALTADHDPGRRYPPQEGNPR